jgi:hypothetical protein
LVEDSTVKREIIQTDRWNTRFLIQ